MTRVALALTVAVALSAGGCASVDYLLQSASGHLELMASRRSIDEVLEDPSTDAGVRARLERVREMRRFAVEELALPAGGSYRHYADVGREYVVWSVTAAPELSLEPEQWCYPVVGCLSYRGYFALARAAAEADRLRATGLDVYVAPVRAYSTLGWFDDPVPSTLLAGPDWSVAGTIFHELAHQRVYAPGDTAFNEAYAVAVQLEGERRWLVRHGDGRARERYARYARIRGEFLALVREARSRLEALYASALSDAEKRARKRDALRALRQGYADLREGWDGFRGYDRWFAQDLNNAKLALVSTYNGLVPRFQALLAGNGGDLAAFHAAVARIAEYDYEARRRALPPAG